MNDLSDEKQPSWLTTEAPVAHDGVKVA